ncbi:MAG TPA: Ig-like domain-containing protein, partial [Pirellulaceae bacterium]
YAFMVPATSIGDPLNPGASGETFSLSASHPTRLDQVVVVANPAISIGRFSDLIFPARGRGPSEDPNPPRISVFHSPTFPAPGAEAQVVVLATHGSGQPAVSLTAVSSSPTTVDLNSDVEVSLLVREPIGSTAVRSTFRVTCKSNAVVVFNAIAELSTAGVGVAPYAINFSGTGFPVQNPAPSDVHDISGPQVIYSEPRNDLGQSAPALRPGEPIVIVFNEAISKSVLDNPAAVALNPAAGDLVKELSADQRVLTVRAYALTPDTPYTLTLNSQISDLVSEDNRLDQNPSTQEPDPFILKFRTAPMPTGTLFGIEYGGGAVLRGIYAYVLERAGALDGAVVVYDLSNPLAPEKVAEISVPGFPRDLALIPNYSFTKSVNPGAPVETKDLLAVVGGKVGGAADERGNLLGAFQYLWIIDIDDPDDPVRIASALVTASPSSVVSKIQWSPPFLAYLESDADSQAVSL